MLSQQFTAAYATGAAGTTRHHKKKAPPKSISAENEELRRLLKLRQHIAHLMKPLSTSVSGDINPHRIGNRSTEANDELLEVMETLAQTLLPHGAVKEELAEGEDAQDPLQHIRAMTKEKNKDKMEAHLTNTEEDDDDSYLPLTHLSISGHTSIDQLDMLWVAGNPEDHEDIRRKHLLQQQARESMLLGAGAGGDGDASGVFSSSTVTDGSSVNNAATITLPSPPSHPGSLRVRVENEVGFDNLDNKSPTIMIGSGTAKGSRGAARRGSTTFGNMETSVATPNASSGAFPGSSGGWKVFGTPQHHTTAVPQHYQHASPNGHHHGADHPSFVNPCLDASRSTEERERRLETRTCQFLFQSEVFRALQTSSLLSTLHITHMYSLTAIPVELVTHIPSLTALDFSHCAIRDLPPQLFYNKGTTQLPHLTELILDNNQLLVVPNEISCCKRLRCLSLENNKIIGLPLSLRLLFRTNTCGGGGGGGYLEDLRLANNAMHDGLDDVFVEGMRSSQSGPKNNSSNNRIRSAVSNFFAETESDEESMHDDTACGDNGDFYNEYDSDVSYDDDDGLAVEDSEVAESASFYDLPTTYAFYSIMGVFVECFGDQHGNTQTNSNQSNERTPTLDGLTPIGGGGISPTAGTSPLATPTNSQQQLHSNSILEAIHLPSPSNKTTQLNAQNAVPSSVYAKLRTNSVLSSCAVCKKYLYGRAYQYVRGWQSLNAEVEMQQKKALDEEPFFLDDYVRGTLGCLPQVHGGGGAGNTGEAADPVKGAEKALQHQIQCVVDIRKDIASPRCLSMKEDCLGQKSVVFLGVACSGHCAKELDVTMHAEPQHYNSLRY